MVNAADVSIGDDVVSMERDVSAGCDVDSTTEWEGVDLGDVVSTTGSVVVNAADVSIGENVVSLARDVSTGCDVD